MPRQTKKYVAACRLAGVPSHAEVPHEAVYGMLALRGFTWEGNEWKQTNRPPHVSRYLKIRITANPDDLDDLTLMIADMLVIAGMEVKSINGPYPNKKDKNSRIYLNAKYTIEGEK